MEPRTWTRWIQTSLRLVLIFLRSPYFFLCSKTSYFAQVLYIWCLIFSQCRHILYLPNVHIYFFCLRNVLIISICPKSLYLFMYQSRHICLFAQLRHIFSSSHVFCSLNILRFNCASAHVPFARYLLYQYIVDITEMLHFRFIDSYPVVRSIKCFASFCINIMKLPFSFIYSTPIKKRYTSFHSK